MTFTLQLDMFAAFAPPAPVVIRRPVEPHGHVVQGEVDETLILPHARMAWDSARIELHRHTDGLWMWSTSFQTDNHGSTYRVGAKWGKFVETRDAALQHAIAELRDRLAGANGKGKAAILAWAATLE